jgi:type IV pilus assembly protein PilO
MAAYGAMAEFGRLPASRKVLAFAVAGLLLGGLYYRFVYAPLAEDTEEARDAYESRRRTRTLGAASIKKYADLRPEMDKLREELARDQAALPTEAELPAFFETLERKVKESGVEITKWTKRAEEPVESFVKVPVEVEITGTFMQIKRFFASLVPRSPGPGAGAGAGASSGAGAGVGSGSGERERQERERQERERQERERIVSIESLVLSQPQVRDREIVLGARVVAVTFRREEAAAAPARPGAPAVPPGTPPPLRPGSAPPAARADEATRPGSGARADQAPGSGDAGADRLRKGI